VNGRFQEKGSMPRIFGVKLLPLVVTYALAAACSGESTSPPAPAGQLRIVQAAESTAALDVLIDGGVVISGLRAGTVSSPVSVTPGQRTVQFRAVGGATSPNSLQLSVSAKSIYTAIVIDSSTVLDPITLTDTGGIPASGMTKLRVAHFAALGPPIDVYRHQPDFPGLLGLQFPFPYRSVTSYVQSTPGNWQVVISPEVRVNDVPLDVPQDTLLATDVLPLAAGQVATVVLLDRPGGGLDAVVVHDR
jgi:hypothetical protein